MHDRRLSFAGLYVGAILAEKEGPAWCFPRRQWSGQTPMEEASRSAWPDGHDPDIALGNSRFFTAISPCHEGSHTASLPMLFLMKSASRAASSLWSG